MADVTIKLGEKEFKISPLTIRQSRDLRIGDASTPTVGVGPEFWTNLYDLCIKTVLIAIREDHKDVTEDQLFNIRTTEEELAEARRKILVHAGFKAPETTIAELRANIAAMKIEIEDLEKTLVEREAKAKVTGEG